ncbi:MAG TPA: SDR family oxidoreductase [Deinococcales bacterium]|nr:SDR family oxidoreductase [Deinococcales bacterium]
MTFPRGVLVTGGSKGIGRAIAQAFVRAGSGVLLTSRHEAEAVQAASDLTAIGPGRAVGVEADVRVYDQIEGAAAQAAQEFGRLDLAVANAGVGIFAPVDELTLEDWHEVLDTNLTGAFYTAKATAGLLASSRGLLVFISSLAGRNAFAGGAAYNASKFGLNGFAEAAMLDLRPKGVRVSAILPGSVATHFNNHEPNPADAWKIQPEDIAQLVLDLWAMPARTLPSRIEVRPSQPKSS